MDFIEQWFGLSPDGGDGSTEVLCLVAVVVLVAVIAGGRHVSRALARRR
ncbi:hypothetical protein [Jiella sonneratiae]|uniref:Uncharacterized protein n=1 Tax=Jiella sonneratiae TaxID=2816856 RepID=A0ABS3IYA1_9HYPH|nr:hypothetical protein [Jiella sonneratiae]MBO0902391.1 hypothetical protein [Jiella sonneratiae]